MRAIGFHRFGGPDVLTEVERPVPEPGPGEVRIRVAAAAVNPSDLMLRSGELAHRVSHLRPPYVPGWDASGTVAAAGGGVAPEVGERVMAVVNPFDARGGAQAEYIVVPSASVAAVPAVLDLIDVAGLPMNGLTADLALRLVGLSPGAWLGVTGGSGALGGYVIQLAKAGGLNVIAESSDSDRAWVRGLGADVVVPRQPDQGAAYRVECPDGVAALIDAAVVGPPAFGAIADGGAVVNCRSVQWPDARGIVQHPLSVPNHPQVAPALRGLVDLAATGRLTLRTAARLAPCEVAEAHRRLAAGGVRGRRLLLF